ncbi:anthranilate synthase component I family protein [Brevundimonas subvibrioides]|uniref:Chorismate binding-like protein n=1 Tax=Brevundimonas subvibrioides (strain ATCC 15264 / DSM 4735 / LMG 14903 / NBRC 16000 / CB 81) TaxID=633149 RepID=D9QLA8_BRESC|nr:anthranilate synthase component I family protein [Brevundimonas subvibrioides]ADK99963.1 Chorismate binding-like protein [Brevundimonas subvibrioides ATCC 15264]
MSTSDRFVLTLPWAPPLAVAGGLAARDGALCLLSDGGPNGRVSWVGAEPDVAGIGPVDDADPFAALRQAGWDRHVIGLAAYDAGARPATGERGQAAGDWPDLMVARYPALLRFHHPTQTIQAIGIGPDAPAQARRAADWIASARPPSQPAPPAGEFGEETPETTYTAAVADVVERIGAGELFQANIARAWGGALEPGTDPFDVFVRLATGAAPYGAFWRLGERVLVSNSPELFLTFDPADGRIETRPIKGTRRRDADPVRDAANAADLVASAKDRAENLMIVDLMRNDLARVSVPGSVRVERLFALESFATVHHLVSTVAATAAEATGPADILNATFPPGSITGAPKHQAMKVIAAHEPPRGPWCGSLFLLDDRGRMTASVLIRTASFWREEGQWRFRTLAGAGIVADSDPRSESAETDAKIVAIRRALTGT